MFVKKTIVLPEYHERGHLWKHQAPPPPPSDPPVSCRNILPCCAISDWSDLFAVYSSCLNIVDPRTIWHHSIPQVCHTAYSPNQLEEQQENASIHTPQFCLTVSFPVVICNLIILDGNGALLTGMGRGFPLPWSSILGHLSTSSKLCAQCVGST